MKEENKEFRKILDKTFEGAKKQGCTPVLKGYIWVEKAAEEYVEQQEKENTVKIEKLKKVLKQLNEKSMKFWNESTFCRDRNFNIEAQILHEKHMLMEDCIREIKMKVIDETIEI